MKPATLVLLLATLLLAASPACQARTLRPSPFTSTKDVWIARFERFVLGEPLAASAVAGVQRLLLGTGVATKKQANGRPAHTASHEALIPCWPAVPSA
jgi:hypothetical protein